MACLALMATAAPAQEAPEQLQASTIFEAALDTSGLAAAVARLETILADTTGTYAIDGYELGLHYLHTGDLPAAERAWRRSLEIRPNQPQLAWMLENGVSLAETVELQRTAEGCWAPGENTGLQGPYLGQEPPGNEPEGFALGVLSTLEHEYSIAF